MKPLLIIYVIILSTMPERLLGQGNEHHESIKKQLSYQQSLADDGMPDTDIILKHTYPGIIDAFGGKEEYVAFIEDVSEDEDDEEDYEDDEEEEGSWTLQSSRTELGTIGTVYRQGDELQAVVEVKEIEEYSDRLEVYRYYQLAISKDNGKKWYFIDGTLDWNEIVPQLHPSIHKPEESFEAIEK